MTPWPERRAAWSSLRTLVALTATALLPVALLAASSIVLASQQVTREVDERVQATAAGSAVFVGLQTRGLQALVHSYATRPGLAGNLAAGAAGRASTDAHLRGLTSTSEDLSGAFIADLRGTVTNFAPPAPTVTGHSFAYRDWFTGLAAAGGPYVSTAYQSALPGHPLAAVVTDYIRGANGRPVGILGAVYSLEAVRIFAAHLAAAQGITLTVTDRAGTLLSAGAQHTLVSLAADPRVRAARAGRSGLVTYRPALPGGGRGAAELSAYLPVAESGWTVTASVSDRVAFAGLARLRATVLGITAVLVLVVLVAAGVLARATRGRADSEQQVRHRDRQLSRLLDSTDEGLVSIDTAGVITAWSRRTEELFGWPAADVLGRSLADVLVPPAQRRAHLHGMASYHAGAPSTMVGRRVQVTARHRDGHELPVELAVWAHEDGAGFSGFVHDVSERVATQAELRDARDQAMQASRRKSELLASMSREVRTPLAGVIGMSDLLLGTGLDAEQRDYAETVHASAEALLTVVDEIVDFTAIESGMLAVDSVPFDLRLAVEESALMLAARAQQDGLELTCLVDVALPAVVEGDPGRLRQVLANLLGNAVTFTAAGEINVEVRPVGEPMAGRLLVAFVVRDTGVGMPAAVVERLFDTSPADGSAPRRYAGTGQGLVISRQLVEAMGGTLTVLSAPGTGSRFTATVAFGLGPAAAAPEPAADLTGRRVLVVDDTATSQCVLQEMITGWGATVVTADAAQPALLLLRAAAPAADPFDVALVDLHMPGVDGWDLVGLIRDEPLLADLPLVLLTGADGRRDAERIESLGVAGQLAKPVRAGPLQAVLASAVQGHTAVPGDTAAGTGSAGAVSALVPAGVPRSRVPEPRRPAGETVLLLVEDNIVNQKVYVAVLARLGYHVDVAGNGVQALERMERTQYAAVLMDCRMPVMDGFQATAELRRREGAQRHTPVIAMTAADSAADRERCLAVGMDDFLSKPVSAEHLADTLALWLTGEGRPTGEPHPASTPT